MHALARVLLSILSPLMLLGCFYQLPEFNNPVDPLQRGTGITFGRGRTWRFECAHPDATGEFELTEAADGELSWTRSGTGGSSPFGSPVPMYMLLHFVYLPSPLVPAGVAAGTSWSGAVTAGSVGGWTGETTVVDMAAEVTVPAGSFSDSVLLETVFSGTGEYLPSGASASAEQNGFVRGTRRVWISPSAGILRVEYAHEDGTLTTAVLEGYDVQGPGDVMPLSEDNLWLYSWQRTPTTENPVLEECIIVGG
jgi:hypothetical protein